MKAATTYLVIAGAVIAAASCNDDDNGNQPTASPRVVERTDIVSDQGAAKATDPKLVNAWGLAFNPIGAAWVSATETGVSGVYDASGKSLIPPVSIPSPTGPASTSAPTGQVFNDDTSTFQGDLFIFVTENGTIAGWQQSNGTEAVQRVDNSASEAVYKGVTIARNATGGPRLLAADFRGGKVDVFDSSYAPVTADAATMFRDPDIPADFAPFNVEVAGDFVIVTYAKQDEDKEDDVKGAGNGYVDQYDSQGLFLGRLVSQGELDSPWGVTMAPDSFAPAPGKLLIGNFGDGRVHVYDANLSPPARIQLEGTLRNAAGTDIVIDGLWALKFGVDAGGFSSSQLYFTAGPSDETHGTFGALDAAAATAADGGTDGGATGGAGGATPDGGGVPSGTGGATGTGGSTGTGGGPVSAPAPGGPYRP